MRDNAQSRNIAKPTAGIQVMRLTGGDDSSKGGSMGRIRRGGYIITWFIGDHKPRHVHVETSDGDFIGRLNLETRKGMEGWQPDKKLLQVIKALEKEGRL